MLVVACCHFFLPFRLGGGGASGSSTSSMTPYKSSSALTPNALATVRWTPCESGTCLCTGKLVLDTDRERVTYGLVELPTTWAGRAAKLIKADGSGESYDTFAHESDPRHDRCDCKGFLHVGHCKHVDGLRALVQNRWLTDPRANPDCDTGATETTDQECPANCQFRPADVLNPNDPADLQGGF